MSDTHTDMMHQIEELQKQMATLQEAINNLADAAHVSTPTSDATANTLASASAPTSAPAPAPVPAPASAPAPVPASPACAPVPVPLAPASTQMHVEQSVGSTPQQTAGPQSQHPINQAPVPPAGFNQAQYHATQNQRAAVNYGNGYAAQVPVAHHKDHVAAALLAIFLGLFGVHKFYLGYNTSGFIMLGVTLLGSLLTFGFAAAVVWLIGLVEGIVYLVKTQPEFEEMYVRHKREWF